MQDYEDIFGAEGPLARSLAGFVPRRAQMQMATRVAEALATRGNLIVEAGTGTGKTFAYLVPALLSNARVLISTGTRTLQDQLHSKDVPLVARALGAPARIALLKGRSNYLCRQRLARSAAQGTLEALAVRDPLRARVEAWAEVTHTGDLAEVAGLTEGHPLWPQVTSTRENCLGQRCEEYARCHVVAARREAQEADVVVVNHHLLLADLALKEDGFGDLLGTSDAVILDEAHQLPDLATQFFGERIGTRQVENLLADSRAAVLRAGLPPAGLGAALHGVEQSLGAMLAVLPRGVPPVRWEDSGADLESFVLGLAAALGSLAAALEATGVEAEVAQSAERAGRLARSLERIALCGEEEGARTVESSGRSLTLGLLPFDIAERFRELVGARRAAWVFTSATLSVGDDFSHFASRLGLAEAPTLRIASPFDYESQALLYLPPGLPDPADPRYVDAVIDASLPLLDASGGGAFLLFTSHRALARAAARLRERWEWAGDLPVLVQGESPRERLLQQFREHGSAVLLGTASFWEGVDVKGEALRLVIIEKLPFASPEEPLVKSRIDFLRRHGGNPFRDYQLPEAVLALKQGFGRLIRSEDDRGLIAICDPRLVEKSYGRVFRASLPEMPATRDLGEATRFLARLAPVTGGMPR
ncbi:MAG: ATP-dependent DNA helicase [Steroidobacteraceae bacterium]|jgi:ATP-dependent DNA helicase DinG|nr:ATP-dependent DNA helicase [Steroidobacteraceae bacterium]